MSSHASLPRHLSSLGTLSVREERSEESLSRFVSVLNLSISTPGGGNNNNRFSVLAFKLPGHYGNSSIFYIIQEHEHKWCQGEWNSPYGVESGGSSIVWMNKKNQKTGRHNATLCQLVVHLILNMKDVHEHRSGSAINTSAGQDSHVQRSNLVFFTGY